MAVWRLSGSVLLRCFLAPLGVLFVMKTLEDERWGVITAYKLIIVGRSGLKSVKDLGRDAKFY